MAEMEIPALAEEASFVYTDVYFIGHILRGMERMWNREDFCDITLILGDVRIRAHKLVLSCLSRYFEVMFGPNMAEGRMNEIPIPNLDGEIVGKIIAFAYTGRIEITGKSVQGILEVANFMEVESVCNGCCKYLENHMDKDNCLGIYQLADNLGLNTLKDASLAFSARHFVEICACTEFVDLPVTLMKALVGKDSLNFIQPGVVPLARNQEQGILKALLYYVQHDMGSRLNHLGDLLGCIKLQLLPVKSLEALINTEPVSGDEKSRTLVMCVLQEAQSTTSASYQATRERIGIRHGMQMSWSRSFAGGGHVRPRIDRFDDSLPARITHVVGMKIWIRRWDGRAVWGGFRIHYSDGVSKKHGEEFDLENYEFRLEEDEVITSVDIQSGWLIDHMTFKTSKGRAFGPYGGPGGGKGQTKHSAYDEDPMHGLLMFLKGDVVQTQGSLAVANIQFCWGSFPSENRAKARPTREKIRDTRNKNESWPPEHRQNMNN